MSNTVVVTRHPALVALLLERGLIPTGTTIIEHATEADIRGKDVIGVLPMRLAALARSVTEVPLELAAEDRGKELSIERLREIAGPATTYYVAVGHGHGGPVGPWAIKEVDGKPTYARRCGPYGEIVAEVTRAGLGWGPGWHGNVRPHPCPLCGEPGAMGDAAFAPEAPTLEGALAATDAVLARLGYVTEPEGQGVPPVGGE